MTTKKLDFEIFSNGTIRRAPGSQPTGCTVAQLTEGTTVWLDGVRLLLPERRYSLATDHPANGIPGRAAFDRDLRDALAEKDPKLTDTECMALVDKAYAEYNAVLAVPHTRDDRQHAWDTAVEKRDAAYARLHENFRTRYGI